MINYERIFALFAALACSQNGFYAMSPSSLSSSSLSSPTVVVTVALIVSVIVVVVFVVVVVVAFATNTFLEKKLNCFFFVP